MKKAVSILLVLVFTALFTVSAMALSTVFVDEYKFYVSVPDDYYVLTRDTEKSADGWALFDESQIEALLQQFKDTGVYVDAIAPDASNEIVVVVTEDDSFNQIFNLNSVSDEEIRKGLGKEWQSTLESMGVEVGDIEFYKTGSLKYFSIDSHVTAGGQDAYVRGYSTVVNGVFLQCNIRSYTGPLTAENKAMIKNVVDSIVFSEIKEKAGSSGSSSYSTPSSSSYGSSSSSSYGSSSSSSSIGGAFVKGAVTAAFFGVIGAITSAVKKKKGKDTAGTQQPGSSAGSSAEIKPAEPLVSEGSTFCGQCGQELPPGQKYCTNCGAKNNRA